MKEANCNQCYDGSITRDWVNLQSPELSRILRAPLALTEQGLGREICRDHKVDPKRKRINLLRSGRYEHAVKPLEFFSSEPMPGLKPGGKPAPSFASVDAPYYKKMLSIINDGRQRSLSRPRIDMPGAIAIAGEDRIMVEPDLPSKAPSLRAGQTTTGQLQLWWERTAANIGLPAEVHRSSKPDFEPTSETLLAQTMTNHVLDGNPDAAKPFYALVLKNRAGKSSAPTYMELPEQVRPLR